MKVKVKIQENGRTTAIQYIEADDRLTLDALFDSLVTDKILSDYSVQQLKQNDMPFSAVKHTKVKNIFDNKNSLALESSVMKITLSTQTGGGKTFAQQSLLDFTMFFETIEQYCRQLDRHFIPDSTVFYIQQDEAQFLVRKEMGGLEFFHFQQQYENAFKSMGRSPFMTVMLKTRQELSKDELKWLRSVSYPQKGRKNALIHLTKAALDEDVLTEICTLIHRVVVTTGHFQKNKKMMSDDHTLCPAYVEMPEATSIGYVKREQLDAISTH